MIRAASGDGEPALAVVTGAGDHIYPYSITDVEPFDGLDLAIAACPSLSRLPALPLDFDGENGLGLWWNNKDDLR